MNDLYKSKLGDMNLFNILNLDAYKYLFKK